MANFPLKGSERRAVPGATVVGPADPNETFHVSVLVRRLARAALSAKVQAVASGGDRNYLSREEFARRHGADPADINAVRTFAKTHGLSIIEEHAGRRTVILSGTAAQFSAAFQVTLQRCSYQGGTFRGRIGTIMLPEELNDRVEAVLGLDNRPQARPHFRILDAAKHRASGTVSYTPVEVAALYAFPVGTGSGECVGLIELGGGFKLQDLQTYFSGLELSTPEVLAVSVDQASNSPTGSPDGPDGEVMLDIEVVGCIAQQAKVAVYFTPNTDAGFLDAITTAIHDTANKPAVISISWGGPESSWTAQAMTAMDDAFQTASTLGITVCVASGDSGSSDGVASGDHVDFPASSPYVLACGGTRLNGSGTTIKTEVVWNDGASGGASGGGVSTFFALPAWQDTLHTVSSSGVKSGLARRGVPDVAGNADPESGYKVRIDGTDTIIGGTSAVAPLWAALVARLNQTAGTPVGYLNPKLYPASGVCHDITQGNNGDFAAVVGWDACTGLGSPNGKTLAGALST